MAEQQHPMEPSPELVRNFWMLPLSQKERAAYRAGADAELDACCEWLNQKVDSPWALDAELRAARRPKPPSLAEQALTALEKVDEWAVHDDLVMGAKTIRAALERLQELEKGNE